MADQTQRAWVDFLKAKCLRGPVLLALEDLQWADAPSVELMETAMRSLVDQPMMVTAWARNELEIEFPDLWRQRGPLCMELAVLKSESALELTKQTLDNLSLEAGDALKSEGLAEQIVERSGGHPFYLEELLRLVASGGTVSSNSDLPDSLVGLLQSRLEHLGNEPRRILRAGAIYGTAFSPAALTAILGRKPEPSSLRGYLEFLVEQDVLQEVGEGTAPRFAFQHDLLREAAYVLLTPEDKVRGHLAAGLYLEQHTLASDDNPMELVRHFISGEQEQRAAHYCGVAAQQAFNVNDLVEATSRADKAAQMGLNGVQLGRVSLTQARAYYWRGMPDHAAVAAKRASENLQGEERLLALGEHAHALGQMGELDDVEALVRVIFDASPTSTSERPVHSSQTSIRFVEAQVEALLRGMGAIFQSGRREQEERLWQVVGKLGTHVPPSLQIDIDVIRGNLFFLDARPWDAEKAYARAALNAIALGDRLRQVKAESNQAAALVRLAESKAAFDKMQELVGTASELGIGLFQVIGKVNMALTASYLNRPRDALRLADELLAIP